MDEFSANNVEILRLLNIWEPILKSLPKEIIETRQNSQNRSIKQLLGHLIDSASNNLHRIVHMQYQSSPINFPDYANFGNNDRWIEIQNYQNENWEHIIELWKYSNIHLVHVISNVDMEKIENEWITALGNHVSLKTMILDYLRHLKLHLSEISALVNV